MYTINIKPKKNATNFNARVGDGSFLLFYDSPTTKKTKRIEKFP
jgi:hypothetical protein